MKFSQIPYIRPDMEELKLQFGQLFDAFNNSKDFNEQNIIFEEINKLRRSFETQKAIGEILYTIDTTNKKYEEEKDFLNENLPQYREIVSRYYNIIINSRFRDQLEAKWGKQLFTLAKLKMKTFSPEIIEDLQTENKLVSQYVRLRTSARIPFQGGEYNLAQMVPFYLSPDREVRKSANEAQYRFFKENEDKFDQIYDGLVKTRNKIAKKLGLKDFIEYRYAQLGRSDYSPEDVASFRGQILEHVVPITQKLREKQRLRLGVDKLKYYDDLLDFKSGNPTPMGDNDWIIKTAGTMFKEMSPQTDQFFNFMRENELMNIETRKGKTGGCYCKYIPGYKSPFIFDNFNRTYDDIDTITHEGGHAFQLYVGNNLGIPEYEFATYEVCETHSMSMELFAWPWMDRFFKEPDKYRFMHINKALLFMPYGTAIDEFQHFVYENPDVTPNERKAQWRNIEKKYLPHRDYDGNEYLERGGFWHRQSHLFDVPFYYIDYVIAQICAFQFWQRANVDRTSAWNDYLNLCREGGSKSFAELLKTAKLKSPFEKNCVESVVKDIEKWIDNVDTTKF